MEVSKYLKTQIDLTVALIINEKLSVGVTTIEFYKADDSVRKMRATRDNALLPETEKEIVVTAYESNLVKVFDVEKKAWRSFKIDRLKSIDDIPAKDFITNCFTVNSNV